MSMQKPKHLFRSLLVAGFCLLGGAKFLQGCSQSHSRPVGMADVAFDISPQGDSVVFTAMGQGGRDIYLLDLKSSHVIQVTRTPDYEGDPVFSPDGQSILYTAGVSGERADHIFFCSLDGTKVKQVTTQDYNDTAPSLSSDGSRVVFARNLTYNWGGLASSWGQESVLYTMKIDGSQQRRLTRQDLYATSPRFTPDGKNIVCSGSGVYLIASGGSRPPRKLTAVRGSDEVDISPNGKQVVFIADPSGENYLNGLRMFLINTNGTGQREIKITKAGLRPRFAPDGKHIYFLVETWPDGPSGTPHESLWRIGVDGKNMRQVADTRLFDDPLQWQP